MSPESGELCALSGFDGSVDSLPREAVYAEKFLHVLDANVMGP